MNGYVITTTSTCSGGMFFYCGYWGLTPIFRGRTYFEKGGGRFTHPKVFSSIENAKRALKRIQKRIAYKDVEDYDIKPNIYTF